MPRFGEPGYPMVVDAAFDAGDITEGERAALQYWSRVVRRIEVAA